MGRSRFVCTASPILAAALILTLVLPAAAASGRTPVDLSQPHCISRLAPAAGDQDSGMRDAVVVESRCFATFAEAFEYGSLGAIKVPADLQPGDVTQAMAVSASASTQYLLGTYWQAPDYMGWSYSWFASSGCTSTSGWQVSYVGSAQDDKYYSSKSYSGCERNRHFEHPNFGGATLLCQPNCSNLGIMNGETSSLRWFG